MLDRIPLRGPGWIMRDRHRQVKGGGELGLNGDLPRGAPIAIAPAGVRQDQELARTTIGRLAFAQPPVGDPCAAKVGVLWETPTITMPRLATTS